MKEEPAAAGRGACRRGTPLSILGFRVGAVVTGGGLIALGTAIWAVVAYELVARAREVVGV